MATLIGLVILAVIVVFVVSGSRMNTTYDIQVQPVEIPAGEEAIAWGEHISIIRGCAECHQGDFSGGSFIDDPAIGQINPTNLTSGQGGVGSTYTDIDWVRAIRHGVGPDGKPLLFMAANEFYFLSDEDLGALIAYLKSVRPVDNQTPNNSVGPLGRILFLAGQFPLLLPAEAVAHNDPRPVAPERRSTVEYGQYMAQSCIGCHGPGFSGGPIPGVPSDWPPAPNLTSGGNMANWSEVDFINSMRDGETPSGQKFNSEYMPWPSFGPMTDEELQALWLYLQSLPATPTGNR